ncbi:MAG: hypothetical protein V1753_00740 [Pseudomonadota bacterium]
MIYADCIKIGSGGGSYLYKGGYDSMDALDASSYGGSKRHRDGSDEGVYGVTSQSNSVWLVDFLVRMQTRFGYVEVSRNTSEENNKLKEAGWCSLFQCKILPGVCEARGRYGYTCEACHGVNFHKSRFPQT